MDVKSKVVDPSDPNSGEYYLTRADGAQERLSRYPSGWRLAGQPRMLFRTKKAAIAHFSVPIYVPTELEQWLDDLCSVQSTSQSHDAPIDSFGSVRKSQEEVDK